MIFNLLSLLTIMTTDNISNEQPCLTLSGIPLLVRIQHSWSKGPTLKFCSTAMNLELTLVLNCYAKNTHNWTKRHWTNSIWGKKSIQIQQYQKRKKHMLKRSIHHYLWTQRICLIQSERRKKRKKKYSRMSSTYILGWKRNAEELSRKIIVSQLYHAKADLMRKGSVLGNSFTNPHRVSRCNELTTLVQVAWDPTVRDGEMIKKNCQRTLHSG